MKNLKKVFVLAFLVATTSIVVGVPLTFGSVSNYEITDITQTAPDTIVVTARCIFCSACNPNNPGGSDRGDGCIPFACGYPPPSFPAYASCQRGSPDGRYAAIRITGSFGSKTQKLICDQSNWRLSTLWSHNFIFDGLSFEHGETIKIEADFYCSYCMHWYAVPKTFTPNPYTFVFIPLNWQGSIDSFKTNAQDQANYLINEVSKLTKDNTKIIKVEQNLPLDFDKSDPDNFRSEHWNAIVNHATSNGATGDMYIALTNEDLWDGVAGMNRAMYGNTIIIDKDGLGATETLAHEVGHGWGLLEEYNYIRWLAEKNEVRADYSYNSYPTSDDPNMPYPPPNLDEPDYSPVRCPGRSFDDKHCVMGPAGYWYRWLWYLGPIPVDDYVYFGWPLSDGKGFCQDCNSAINSNLDKIWGASGKGLAQLVVTFFKDGTTPRIEGVEGLPIAGKSMHFDGPADYSIRAYSETGSLYYASNISCSFLTNLPYMNVSSMAKPLEVDSVTFTWLAPAFSQNKITVELVDNAADKVVDAEEILITTPEASIDYVTTDKDAYDSGEVIDVTIEVNTTRPSMSVVVDATLFDPDGTTQDYESWSGVITPPADPKTFQLTIPISAETGTWKIYVVVLNSTGQFQDSEVKSVTVGGDKFPPTTTLATGSPQYIDSSGDAHVTSDTPFTLSAEDNVDGSGVATTGYCIRDVASYNSGWTASVPPIEFYLTGLADGDYFIDFNSTDSVGNIETTHTVSVILDNSGPSIVVENPPPGWALQDGVTFIASASDSSGTHSLNFSIREANGDQGIPVGFEDIPATYDAVTGRWNWYFNTLQLPDGYYIVLVNAEDNLGHTSSITVPYSIRNWAVLELLPASESNKAGRTMPVKFALRVAASVDPDQPFVYNEDLTIKIYATNDPSKILQTSTYGETARDYRINTASEKYITNFQTLKTPMQYTVSVYRGTFLIDYFSFATVK